MRWNNRCGKNLSREVAVASPRLLAACRRLGRIDLLLAEGPPGRGNRLVPAPADRGQLHPPGGIYKPGNRRALGGTRTVFSAPFFGTGPHSGNGYNGGQHRRKSVTLKSVGLAVVMVQLSLLVPAREFGIFPARIYLLFAARRGCQPRAQHFGAEIRRWRLGCPTRTGTGSTCWTNRRAGNQPLGGSALVRAILHWLAGGNSLTLAATHFPGVAGMPRKSPIYRLPDCLRRTCRLYCLGAPAAQKPSAI